MSETAQETTAAQEARLRAIVEEVIAGTPHFIVEVRVRGRKGARVVEVFLDSDGPLGVDELARLSREIGFLLDVEELFDGRYHLNVSSPGLDRPLSLPRQYRKNVGRLLRVRYRAGDAVHSLQGKLKSADDDGIEIDTGRRTLRISFGDIEEAKVQLPW
ncbi:ribosome maturation factor RimP [Rhodocaloribacter litoris]|uniref:ribosome maturation factor RimP n=1 Tax=Rhodocaloribacter litoris TaxID=2558931 RepID=UPI00141F14F8|nr:ribosome maturation factor RimP [Rhodocaloribacter litoris]QXD14788.1 ribosome maturation factor RimP [Rhodocaloribacter litoris]GIV59125.1 MAG: ribosome maturation factor RimP [Rhodothermaceae bacterium]